jgi:hypothetical protein
VEDDLSTAEIGLVLDFRTCGVLKDGANLPGLGKSHPEDQDELEDVVEGCAIRSAWAPGRSLVICTYGTSRRR